MFWRRGAAFLQAHLDCFKAEANHPARGWGWQLQMLCHTWLQKWDMIHFTVKSRRARSNLKSLQQIAGLWGFCLPRAFSLFSLMGSLGQQFKGDCDSCHLLRLLALSLAVILSLIALNSESTSTVAKNSVWNWNSNYINFSNCQCSVREATSKHRTGTQREKPLYQAGVPHLC